MTDFGDAPEVLSNQCNSLLDQAGQVWDLLVDFEESPSDARKEPLRTATNDLMAALGRVEKSWDAYGLDPPLDVFNRVRDVAVQAYQHLCEYLAKTIEEMRGDE